VLAVWKLCVCVPFLGDEGRLRESALIQWLDFVQLEGRLEWRDPGGLEFSYLFIGSIGV
jgi:hypothetical protein